MEKSAKSEAWDRATTLTEAEIGPRPDWHYVFIVLVVVPIISITALAFTSASVMQTRMAVSWTTVIVTGVVWIFERGNINNWQKQWAKNLEQELGTITQTMIDASPVDSQSKNAAPNIAQDPSTEGVEASSSTVTTSIEAADLADRMATLKSQLIAKRNRVGE